MLVNHEDKKFRFVKLKLIYTFSLQGISSCTPETETLWQNIDQQLGMTATPDYDCLLFDIASYAFSFSCE